MQLRKGAAPWHGLALMTGRLGGPFQKIPTHLDLYLRSCLGFGADREVNIFSQR
jgi:hypothetical protein